MNRTPPSSTTRQRIPGRRRRGCRPNGDSRSRCASSRGRSCCSAGSTGPQAFQAPPISMTPSRTRGRVLATWAVFRERCEPACFRMVGSSSSAWTGARRSTIPTPPKVLRSPWAVGVVVLVIYGAWLVAFFGLGHSALDFTFRSPGFLNQSHASSVINPDPTVTSNAGAYDSQFFYYMALDPVNARYYMDANTYRYTRILYPMVARVLGLGQPGLMPDTLILVHWLALAGGAGGRPRPVVAASSAPRL